MTREEIEQRLDELAQKYVETHDPKIIEQLYQLGRELQKIEVRKAVTRRWLNAREHGAAKI